MNTYRKTKHLTVIDRQRQSVDTLDKPWGGA
jgi:hypothetical protein